MLFSSQRIFLFFGWLLFWLQGQAQTSCAISNETEEQKQFLIRELLNHQTKQARRGTAYVIYIKPKIIHINSGNQLFKETQVFELVAQLNTVFSPINVQFQIENNFVQHIYDNELFDLKVSNEAVLRTNWDDKDGINLYFTHSITKSDLSLLNGYTSLPNLGNSSNAIILSYLENDANAFGLLKNKIIAHEFGHYFGLYHTYQDSNESDLNKRELVTRSIGSNCASTGDLICDTQADPYERVPSIFSLGCTEKLPNNVYDINGDYYTPPVDNFMSYSEKCGFKFTPMQYQRLEAGLNIRLSPNAEYSISRNVSNFVSVNYFNKNSFCQGEDLIINYQQNGIFDSKNKLSIEISDKNGQNFNEFSNFEVLPENKIKINLGSNFVEGNNYRLVLKTSAPYTESPLSTHFEIKALPTAFLKVSEAQINSGDEVQLQVALGGSGPWSFRDWDGIFYENISSPILIFNVAPKSTSIYTVSQISNACGTLNQSSSVNVEVFQPTIQIEAKNAFCNESLIEIKTLGLNPKEAADYYQIQITGAPNKILIFPYINNNVVAFYFPQQLEKGKTYNLKIIGKKLGEISRTISFVVKDPPEQPKISTPLNVCYGAQDIFLKADGKNLKWFTSENDSNYTYSVLLNTTIPGMNEYFVSQSDESKCESKKSKMEVNVFDPVFANISGQNTIFIGDSATIRVTLKGSPPWKFSIENLGEYNVSSPEFLIPIKPIKSTSYTLNSVSNYCGNGSVSGQANINVIAILANEPKNIEKLSIYPNPVLNQKLVIEIENDLLIGVKIFTLDGKLIKQLEANKTEKIEINLEEVPEGKYILKLTGERNNYSKAIQILK